MKISATTWALGAVALGSVMLVHADPWTHDAGAGFVSTRSAAKRVFPRAAEVSPEAVEIIVAPAAGEVTRLVPSADGHDVLVDGTAIGPADPEAVEGLWASLRMATTLRAVAEDIEMGPAREGEIEIALGDERYSVVVGAPSADGSGLYGAIGDELWIVEEELGLILDQQPQAWLARRAVVADAGQITEVAFADATLRRGADGLWRSTVGDTTALLGTDAVEARIDRLISARLDPLLPDHAGQGEPWVRLAAVGDRRWALRLDGACPQRAEREVLQRGPGWAGCIDSAVTRPWPLPGRSGADDPGRWVEPRLLPHPHASVLRIEMTQPAARTLSRRGGDWVLQDNTGGSTTVSDVQGAEVFRWYTTLRDAEVEARLDAALPERWDVELVLATDTTQALRLRCTSADPMLCQRDDGPVLALRRDDVALAFDRDTFVDRQLFSFPTEDARAIEITAAGAVRQSVHFDMGVWRLDAPEHPEGDDALSEVRLEDMLAAVAGARARAWVEPPSDDPLRTIRVELTPSRQRPSEAVLSLHRGCVAVAGTRAATLDEATCDRLSRDLLHDDAPKFWSETARTLEVTEGGATVRFAREGEALVTEDDAPEAARARLAALASLRATALPTGTPPGETLGTLRVLPARGAAFDVDYGATWARIEGLPWFYALAPHPEP